MRLDFDTKKLASKINYSAERKITKFIIDGTQRLITPTPFDTGRAMANWHISDRRITNQSYTLPKNEKISRAEAAEKSLGRFSSWERRGFKMNVPTYLVNNVAYIIPLEWGSSKQAPKGWIRNTANLMQKKLNEIKDIV